MLKYLRRITEQMENKDFKLLHAQGRCAAQGGLVSDLRICSQFNKNRYDKIYNGVAQRR